VFIARLLPLARTFVSLPAGARRMPLGRFIALTTAGCALWAAGFILVGLLLGASWTAVNSIAGRVMLAVGLILLAVTWRRGHGRQS
jgi:membrane protein DedA with SNARE-associated domain